jgi:hypothetical protein
MYQKITKMKATANSGSAMECRNHAKNAASPKSLMSRENNMQRILLFFAVICIGSVSAFAQDIITLKNGEDIKAFVQDIEDANIKYKKFENPNGPNYLLKKSEVFMIKYANGTKDVFVDKSNSVENKPIPPQPVSTTKTTAETTSLPFQQLIASGSKVLKDGWLELDKTEVQKMMDINPNALSLYNQGIEKNRRANQFLASGISLTASGIVMLACSPLILKRAYYDYGSAYSAAVGYLALLSVGSTFLITGMGMTIPGIVIKVIGQKQIQNAVNMYNSGGKIACAELKFNLTGNGLGMMLKF